MQNWNNKVMFPHLAEYIVRVLKAEFKQSRSTNNPMIVLETEFVRPTEVEVKGVQYNIAGVKARPYYCPTMNLTDSAKSLGAQERTKTLYSHFNLPTDDINFENPDISGFEGKLLYVRADSDAVEQRKDPTAAQQAKGEPGDVMRHPVTREPLVYYNPQIKEIFGICPPEVLAGGVSY